MGKNPYINHFSLKWADANNVYHVQYMHYC